MPTMRIVFLVLCYFFVRIAFSDKRPEEQTKSQYTVAGQIVSISK